MATPTSHAALVRLSTTSAGLLNISTKYSSMGLPHHLLLRHLGLARVAACPHALLALGRHNLQAARLQSGSRLQWAGW